MSTKITPQLRFPEFTDEWQVKKLGDIADGKLSNGVFNDPNKVGSGYKLINVKDMYVDGFIDEATLTKVAIDKTEFQRNKVKNGDLFFTRSSLVKEGIAYTNIYLKRSDDITFDGHLIKLSPRKDQFIPEFLYYLSKTNSARRQLVTFGTTTTMTTIGQKEVSEVEVRTPSKLEQEKIADFLTAVDERIAVGEKKIERLETYKRGVMQKIFSQQIRFKDENGNPYPDWEEKKLGEVARIYQPLTISQSDLTKTGYPVYGANGIIGKYDRFNHKNEQIAVTCRGNTCGVINYTQPKSWITGNAMVINMDDSSKADKKFMYYQLLSQNLNYLITGSGQPQITGDIKQHKIFVPFIKEQQKIADFLTTLDEKITAEKSKLTATRQFKKALLQRMFV